LVIPGGIGPRRRQARRRSAVRTAVACALVVFGLANSASAGAAPEASLDSKIAQAINIENRIETQNRRAEVLDEQYLEAKSSIRKTHAAVAKAESRLRAGQRRVARLRRRLGIRAASLYISAGTSVPLTIDDPDIQSFGSRAQYGAATATKDNRILSAVTKADQRLTALRDALRQRQETARRREKKLKASLAELKKATKRQKFLLASINADIAGLVLQVSLQRQSAAERAARGKLARDLPSLPYDEPGTVRPLTPAAAAAITFARQQLGEPYVYAAAGPDQWDCSGLTMVAWAHGGIPMTHNALAQYTQLPKVPIDQLQPGDLVFFGKPIHHVGIYVGAGTMIEAPHTGAFVRYASIFRADLVLQAARPGGHPAPPTH
jgi:cell wall-associated NlpC family hydrolase